MPRLVLVSLAVLVQVYCGAAVAEPSPERRAELIYLLRQDCGSCHGMTLKGGLGPPLLPMALAGKDEAVLVDTVLKGVPGTPMPPWAFEIARSEARWLIENLKRGLPDGN
jgi:cytochrome c55X